MQSKDLEDGSSKKKVEQFSRRVFGRRLFKSENFTNLNAYLDILQALGEFGTFQRRLVALTFVPGLLSAFFVFDGPLMLETQPYHCYSDWLLTIQPNLTMRDLYNLSLPKRNDGSFEECLMYSPVQRDFDSIVKYGLNDTEECQKGWIYTQPEYWSITREFNLVCGKTSKLLEVRAIFITGILCGSLIIGTLCDSFRMVGRLPESSRRGFGALLLCPGSHTVFYTDLYHPSLEIVPAGRRVPGVPPDLLHLLIKEEIHYGTILNILQRRPLRRTLMILFYVWFSIGLGYFGLISQGHRNKKKYGGYLTLGLLQLPVHLSCIILSEKLGRKNSQILTLFLGGFTSLFTVFVPNDMNSLELTLIILNQIGLTAAITMSFIYTVELFPIFLRQVALGFLSLTYSFSAIAILLIETVKQDQPEFTMMICGSLTMSGGFLTFLLPKKWEGKLPEEKSESPKENDDQKN
ncbi:solute carrier family 22 member 14-like isoform X4 [Sminthopsis crassicaudata]|uniref:solute carrier family 22 member 14-like isoform X4 n=1 Tax=Sminthopsis crassicaudata TaxID=9301 RepID=UPI003D692EF7